MATTTVTVTLQSLIEEALATLQRATERPAVCSVGATALTALASSVTLNITGDPQTVQNSTILENGQELLLVTGRDSSVPANFTVARGYAGTPIQAAPTGTTLLISPLWTRFEARRAILRAFTGPLTASLPNIVSVTIPTTANQYYLSIPSDALQVLRVAVSQISGASQTHWDEIGQWQFNEDVPTSVVATGKMVTFPYGFPAGQNVHVTYQSLYSWVLASDGVTQTNNPGELDTITMPLQAQDLPALYAAAYQLMNREVSRLEIDRVEEWNQEAAIRQGVPLRMVQTLWTEFYKRLEEARRVQNVPKHRPYRPYRTMTNGRWTNGARWPRRRV